MRVALQFFLLIAVCASVGSSAAAAPDPYVIYGKTRAYWQAARYPANISYVVIVSVRARGVERIEHFSSRYDSRNDAIHTSGLSAEELAHPHVPPGGFNVRLKWFGINRLEDPVDYLGVPVLAPNFSFGIAKYAPADQQDSTELVRQVRADYHDPARVAASKPNVSGLKEIGSVEAIARDYDIRLAGLELLNGHQDYHLAMRPVRSPDRYRLRDIWVNAQTFATDQVVTDGNFISGPGPGSRWTVTFTQVGSTPYIATERAESPLKFEDRIYEQATISFSDILPVRRSGVDALATFTTTRGTLKEPNT